MSNEYECIIIIEDNLNDEETLIKETNNENKNHVKEKKKELLKKFYLEDENIFEIGVDEAGRGPLFGRVYSAAVILPKDDKFDHFQMKDSKKFHSKKKIQDVANYIKENAIAWHVSYEDEKCIDEINILQATQKAMHNAIENTIQKVKDKMNSEHSLQLLVDGNYFHPFKTFNNNKIEFVPHACVEGGDNKYTSIAAASILAKVARDNYIEELVDENPYLSENYAIDKNKGYGAQKHMEGIKKYGITKWHRKTFGICKTFL